MAASYASGGKLGFNRHLYFFDSNMGEYIFDIKDTKAFVKEWLKSYVIEFGSVVRIQSFVIQRGLNEGDHRAYLENVANINAELAPAPLDPPPAENRQVRIDLRVARRGDPRGPQPVGVPPRIGPRPDRRGSSEF